MSILKKFSQQQLDSIVDLYKSGKTQQQIGQQYGIARRTIMNILRILKVETRDTQKSRFNNEFVKDVIRLRLSGMTMEQIAIHVNRSTSAVHRVIKKYGDNKPQNERADNNAAVCSEYSNGSNVARISLKYGISSYAVLDILRSNGIEIRDPVLNGGSKVHDICLDSFQDTYEWWFNSFVKYGIPSLSSFVGWSRYRIKKRLAQLNISAIKLEERMQHLDPIGIVNDYNECGNMSVVAMKHNCTVQSVKNHLLANGISIKKVSELFTGDANPFAGKKHTPETVEYCKNIGIEAGRKFWDENPEYIEVVRAKNKIIWSDLNKRREDSKRISNLRKLGKCGSRKGVIECRFGNIPFDSSYERSFIEWCSENANIIHIERDFMIIEYQYDGDRCFIPDFKLWLSNGDFIIVEIKSEWYSRKAKERAKIIAGFDRLTDKFMVVENSFGVVNDRIALSLSPINFNFSDIKLRIADNNEYDSFYSSFHYMGKTGRRGYTLAAVLFDKIIACVTFSSITRNCSATRLGVSSSSIRELVRFCIHPDFHKPNFGSWFLSRAVNDFLKNNVDVNVLISFADTTVGHNGSIYLATNWKYDGDTKPSYHYTDGNVNIHKKTVYNKAVAFGVSERQWAHDNNLVRVREGVKRRFIFRRR